MPNKQQVRDWMDHRTAEHKPPPSQAEIRRQLGWDLLESTKAKDFPERETLPVNRN